MKKNVEKILWVVGIYVFIFFCCAPIAHAVDGSNINNGHTYKHPDYADKGVCDNCHMPHGAVGEKLWSDYPLKDDPKSNKVKDLCGSCHYTDVAGFNGIIESGRLEGDNGNVFHLVASGGTETLGADHVMGFSNPGGTTATIFYTSKAKFNTTTFPFDDDVENNEGFYCGSCHDPHKQPLDASNNPIINGDGDYLRSAPGKVGVHNDRKDFCRQCHLNDYVGDPLNPDDDVLVHAGLNPKCYDCHRVHDAYKYDDPEHELQDLIFVDPVEPQDWFASPPLSYSVPSDKYFESQTCIDCHTAPEGTWEDAPKLSRNRMHHYNGRKWDLSSCKNCHSTDSTLIKEKIIDNLDGYVEKGGAPLDKTERVFSCTSCHLAHSEVGNSNFLRFANFTEDATSFCEYCHASCETTIHSPKSQVNLEKNGGKHWKTQENASTLPTPVIRTVLNTDLNAGEGDEELVGCGGCMFCHFIHPKESEDSREITGPVADLRTDLQTLMRIPAKELHWDDEANENDLDHINRYEALCAGCHLEPGIVIGKGEAGSELDTTKFSHRFACYPDNTKNPSRNIPNKGFHQSDGDGIVPMDDYGTVANQIYCGTCHDVHNNTKSPYLALVINENEDLPASPYAVDEGDQPQGLGFCEQCHCIDTVDPGQELNQDEDLGITHPVGSLVKPSDITVDNWPAEFYDGGSGIDKGITADNDVPNNGGSSTGGVICLTCHNIHAATTSYIGQLTSFADPNDDKSHGKLLVMDNFSSSLGSDMCIACHPDF